MPRHVAFELRDHHLFEPVPFVDHQRIELGQDAVRLRGARQQRVVDHENLPLGRQTSRAHPRALAAAPATEQRAGIGIGGDTGAQTAERLGIGRREAIEIRLVIARRPGTQGFEHVVLLLAAWRRHVHGARAEVVLLTLEPHAVDGDPQRLLHRGQVPLEQLVLQPLRRGRHHDAVAGARGIEDRRQQVGERLAESGRCFREQHATALDGLGYAPGERALAGAVLEARPCRGERSLGTQQRQHVIGQSGGTR